MIIYNTKLPQPNHLVNLIVVSGDIHNFLLKHSVSLSCLGYNFSWQPRCIQVNKNNIIVNIQKIILVFGLFLYTNNSIKITLIVINTSLVWSYKSPNFDTILYFLA